MKNNFLKISALALMLAVSPVAMGQANATAPVSLAVEDIGVKTYAEWYARLNGGDVTAMKDLAEKNDKVLKKTNVTTELPKLEAHPTWKVPTMDEAKAFEALQGAVKQAVKDGKLAAALKDADYKGYYADWKAQTASTDIAKFLGNKLNTLLTPPAAPSGDAGTNKAAAATGDAGANKAAAAGDAGANKAAATGVCHPTPPSKCAPGEQC